jgi:hypothetical protein
MLKLTVNMHRKYPGHEVKAILSFDDLALKSKEFQDNLKRLRNKLEQVIPMSLRVKFVEHAEGLILTAKVDKASDAQSMHYRLTGYIRDAAQSLHFRIA